MSEKSRKSIARNTIIKEEFEPVFNYVATEKIDELKAYILNPDNEIWEVIRGDKLTPLHNACVLDKYPVIETLITQTKIRLGLTGNSNISEKEKNNNKEIFKNFINAKTEIDSLTPIHYASFRGNIPVIKLLIENGADIHVKSTHGLTVLHKAAQGDKPSAIVYFNQKYNFDLTETEENQLNALHLATKSGMDNSVIFLLALGINPNLTDKNGFTALHYAVKFQKTRIIKKLLQKGASNSIKDLKSKKIPSQMSKNPEVQEIFRKKGVCEKLFFKPDISQKTCFSNVNMILFITLHILIILVNFLFLMPFFTSTVFSVIYLVVSAFVFILYISLSCSNPGKMKNYIYNSLLDIVEDKEDIANYCPYCLVKKNYRSIHCLICQKCVDEFDHHCFWVGNCIGKKNYGLFFTFLIYILLNTLFNMVFIILYFSLKTTKEVKELNKDSFPGFLFSENSFIYNRIVRGIIAGVCIVICCSFFFPLFSLFRMQLSTAFVRRQIKMEEEEYERNQLREKLDEEVWEDLEYEEGDTFIDTGSVEMKIKT